MFGISTAMNAVRNLTLKKMNNHMCEKGCQPYVHTFCVECDLEKLNIKKMNKVKAILCDLDGTLALCHEGRDIYDATTCDLDHLNIPVAEIVKAFWYTCEVVFVSGRQEKFREPTEKFIQEHLPQFKNKSYKLLMRKTGDVRPDEIVKKEIYDGEIAPNYDVFFVLDDRNKVVKMWRELGLTCLQVAEGNF